MAISVKGYKLSSQFDEVKTQDLRMLVGVNSGTENATIYFT